jgi:YidC/Oxa1 family membrane protein insertase
MEQARILIAIGLSFLVFFLWELFFIDREAVQPPEKPPRTAEAPETEPAPSSDTRPAASQPPSPTEAAKAAGPAETAGDTGPLTPSDDDSLIRPARTLTVDTPLYRATLSEQGAVLTSFVLKDYRESAEEAAPLKELIPEAAGATLMTGFSADAVPGAENAIYRADAEQQDVRLSGTPRTLSFVWTSAEGIVMEKTFSFSPDTYLIGYTLRVTNRSAVPLRDPLEITLTAVDESTSAYYAFQGPSVLVNQSLEQIDPEDVTEQGPLSGEIQWTAMEKQYFLSALVPRKPMEAQARFERTAAGIIENRLIAPAGRIASGDHQQFQFDLYFGPKSLKILSDLNNDLDRVIDFGWFDILAKPSLQVMNFLYGIIPNYGIAIIILTILIKLLLWPLGNKGYKSMNEMKKLQPEMAKIREKYKDDKKKMNEELMSLYKTYKINPMGGCLPMILQIPVFIALYRMLYGAIELRHAHFFGWIDDLSAPDRLFHFDVNWVPLMEPPYGIPVLTIVMGATMFLQQKMSPPPGDPSQAKMMTFLPIVFTFIFINFPSGLVLYWLVNNVLSIAQQYYIAKKKA